MNPNDRLERHFRLTRTQKNALGRLGLEMISDLLFHFPARYGSVAAYKKVVELKAGDDAVVCGILSKISKTKAFRKKIPMAEAVLGDESGRIKIIWFHQPYIAKMLSSDTLVEVRGRVQERSGKLYIANPVTESVKHLPIEAGEMIFKESGGKKKNSLYPVYPESRGITSRWFYYALQRLFARGAHRLSDDPLSEALLGKYNLPALQTALLWVHRPRKHAEYETARKRFAFEEIFFIQLSRQRTRREYRARQSFSINADERSLSAFCKRFPFSLTTAQKRAMRHILADFKKYAPMTRLLEGDVGSGKTAVAAATAYTVATSRPNGKDFGNLQVAYMAPTEILAKQHFESFIELFADLPFQIGLITGSGCRKFPSRVHPDASTPISRTQLLRWVENGEIPILVGTHALIQKHVRFKNLAYVIIDEQHRFGTMQRYELLRKEKRVPHLLSMTATPIPRTLALTIYGDLDLTLLDEMPPGRKQVQSRVVLPNERTEAYESMRDELQRGRQAYVICPRIDEPDPSRALALNVRSVTEEAVRLKKEVFPEFTIATLHGKLKPKEKEAVMKNFLGKKTDILVATSVVEVGVNVPNATSIIIEGAERFGLAQLHQLRGRVVRSTHQTYCFIFPSTRSKNALLRLKALERVKNGFELAEYDLALRGAGTLSGKKQWGITDVGMEAIKNLKMVEVARDEAVALLEKDPELARHPFIKELLEKNDGLVHFE